MIQELNWLRQAHKSISVFSFRVRIIENNSKVIQAQIEEMKQLRAEYDKKEVKLCASPRQLWRPIPGAAPVQGFPGCPAGWLSHKHQTFFFLQKKKKPV